MTDKSAFRISTIKHISISATSLLHFTMSYWKKLRDIEIVIVIIIFANDIEYLKYYHLQTKVFIQKKATNSRHQTLILKTNNIHFLQNKNVKNIN